MHETNLCELEKVIVGRSLTLVYNFVYPGCCAEVIVSRLTDFGNGWNKNIYDIECAD